jgi:hypothetical protein
MHAKTLDKIFQKKKKMFLKIPRFNDERKGAWRKVLMCLFVQSTYWKIYNSK